MEMFSGHPQWNAIRRVCDSLERAGFTAWLAGGCVRDALLGKTPNDFDIATDATPEQIEKLFPQSLPIGKAFGVMILPFEGFQVEVATFREDREYSDGRRPEGVRFSGPREDAARRDFTVNSLFYDLKNGRVIDFFEGQKDLKEGVLRTVGEPAKRFGEDYLRLLRAARFAAQLGFSLENETYRAMGLYADRITRISRERIRAEIQKILMSERPSTGLQILEFTGLLRALLPDFDWEKNGFATKWHLERTKRTSSSAAWALFFLEAWRENRKGISESSMADLRSAAVVFAKRQLADWRLANAELAAIQYFLVVAAALRQSEKYRPAEWLVTLSESLAGEALELFSAPPPLERKYLQRFGGIPVRLPERLVTGQDLIDWGMQNRRRFGEILDQLFDLQLEGKIRTREQGKAWVLAGHFDS